MSTVEPRAFPRQAVPILVGIAITERLIWGLVRPDYGSAGGEAFMVARAIASGRGFADAYQIGQGPTAHLLPISPAIAGAVMFLMGGEGVLARVALAAWGVACSIGSYLLFFRAFGRLGMSRGARVTALAILCVTPIFFTQEVFDFQAWEGGLAVLLLSASFDSLMQAEIKGWSNQKVFRLAVLAGISFFVNPVTGASTVVVTGLGICNQKSLNLLLRFAVTFLLVSAAFVVPWMLRNDIALGHPVLLRSNAGLELALADRPDAVDGREPGPRYIARLSQIHPHLSLAAYRKMESTGGEVEYSAELGRETMEWLKKNPTYAAILFSRHLLNFVFPPAWIFKTTGTDLFAKVRSLGFSVIMFFAFVAYEFRLKDREWKWLFPLILILLPAIASAPFQPIARYCYIVYALAVYSAVDGLYCLVMRAKTYQRRAFTSTIRPVD